MTDLARTRVRERRWDWAYNFLLEGLHGITPDQVIAILKGDAKLTGDSSHPDGVGYEVDDDQEYKGQLAWLYSGCFTTTNGRVLRPYALVVSWGPEDMYAQDKHNTPDSDSAYRVSFGKRWGEDMAYRSLFYARDRDHDVLRHVRLPNDYVLDRQLPPTSDHSVLFEEVKDYPVIVLGRLPLNDPQDAVERYLASSGRLEVLGYSHSFPSELFRIRQETKVDEDPTLRKTISHITSAEDVDILLEHQKEQRKLGREKDAEEVTAALTDAVAVINDLDRPVRERVAAWARTEQLQRDAVERLADFRSLIEKQAGDDYFDLVLTDHDDKVLKTIKVPTAPFIQWALGRGRWQHLAPPWKAVCPSGMKMINDDPYHTDWMVGAGLDPQDWNIFASDDPLVSAAMEKSFQIQMEYAHVKMHVLSGIGRAEGRLVHLKPGDRLKAGQIGVIRNAGPDYVQAAQDAVEQGGALITEAGGSVAHLVTVFREKNLKIVRVEDARKKFPEGRYVTVDCDAGDILTLEKYDSGKAGEAQMEAELIDLLAERSGRGGDDEQ